MSVLNCFKRKEMSSTQSTEVFTVKTQSNSTLDVEKSGDTTDKKTCGMSARRILCLITVDAPLFILVFLLIGLFELGVIPCHKAGFYCGDVNLAHAFTGDTVSMGFLMSVVLLFPPILIFIVEYILYEPFEFQINERKFIKIMKTTAVLYRNYLYGTFINLAIVEIVKGIAGMPRPVFFELCKPDRLTNCTGSQYVADFECTSEYSWWYQLDSHRSFPSGHTSLSIQAGFFIAWYLQKRIFNWSSKTVFLVPAFQLLCIAFAAMSSVTRVTDHRHHWWDVLAGSVLGFFTVIYTCMVLCDNFTYVNNEVDSSILSYNRPIQKLPTEDTRLVMPPGN